MTAHFLNSMVVQLVGTPRMRRPLLANFSAAPRVPREQVPPKTSQLRFTRAWWGAHAQARSGLYGPPPLGPRGVHVASKAAVSSAPTALRPAVSR